MAHDPEQVTGYLNPAHVTIIGWEAKKPRDVVMGYVKRLQAGEELAPVPLRRISDLEFELDYSAFHGRRKDGGHKRSLAALHAGELLAYRLTGEGSLLDETDRMPVNIRDIVLYD